MTPQLLVGLAKQAGPEAERNARDDTAPGDFLSLFEVLHSDDDLLDAIGLERVEIHQPRVAEWGLRLVDPKLSIYCIA